MKKIFIFNLFLIAVITPFSVFAEKKLNTKLRKERLKIRNYEGAPPVIPHGVESLGRKNCLSCHKKGEAKKNGKVSPITPHPNFTNCRQCHVERLSKKLFITSTYSKYEKVKDNNPENPLGPPYIPHHIQNRENCRVCHLSVTSKKAITPKHSDRSNCTQCHVQLQKKISIFP